MANPNLPRSGGALFRPASAPTLGPRGGPRKAAHHDASLTSLTELRLSRAGSSGFLLSGGNRLHLPRPEVYKSVSPGAFGATFGPPPHRRNGPTVRPYSTEPSKSDLLTKQAYGKYGLPPPAIYKPSTRTGRWSFGCARARPPHIVVPSQPDTQPASTRTRTETSTHIHARAHTHARARDRSASCVDGRAS
jgi:hypothetical protein